MAAPNTRRWKAWINLMPGTPVSLHVTGEVETKAGNFVPNLKMTVPQGINPKILLLTLKIAKKGGVGTDDVAYRPAKYRKVAKKGQYTDVNILYDGSVIAKAKVTEVQ